MVRRVLAGLLLSTSLLYADLLEQKISGLISSHAYERNKRFIELLFAKREEFFTSGRVDFAKVTQRLKENGLLSLTFAAPKELSISFRTSSSALLFAKSLSSSLQSLGYYYFAPQKAEYQGGIFTLDIAMTTEHAIDPTLLIREFEKRGYLVADMKREREDRWSYLLELVSPKIPEAQPLAPKAQSELVRPNGEYWLDLSEHSGMLVFEPAMAGVHIYPVVTLFDSSLRIVSTHTPAERNHNFSVSVPYGVRFVRLSDLYSPANIKSGIKVQLLP